MEASIRFAKLVAKQGRSQRGAVLILVALSLAALMGFLGIVLDLGRLFVTKTELQSAMDACALAASAELKPGVVPVDAQAITRAVNAGTMAGSRNRIGFQGAAPAITPTDVYFSDRLSNNTTTFPFGYLASASADPATARYAMCALPSAAASTWFIQVLQSSLGVTSTPHGVSAFATATTKPAQVNCAIPIGMCKQTAGTPASPFAGMSVGQWMTSKLSTGATGSYDWIDFTPPSGGASELADLIKGPGACNVPAPTAGGSCAGNPPGCVGQQGNVTSLGSSWNTRFGLYKGSNTIDNATPDYTGYAYTPTSWPEQFDAFGGSSATGAPNFQAARSSTQPYQGGTAAGLNLLPNNFGYSNSSAADLGAKGADRRLVTVPVVDCEAWAGTTPQSIPVLGYACALMLHPMPGNGNGGPASSEDVWLEFRGPSNDPNSPCNTYGLAGGTIGPRVPTLVH